jgi:hypothetical protein
VSVPVDLDALRTTAVAVGDEALLVTVSEEATPHVVSVRVHWATGRMELGAGRRTAANVAVHSTVTVVWPTVTDGGYRLIVDGDATVSGDTVIVTPTFAILHRVAGATGDGPTCRPVGS